MIESGLLIFFSVLILGSIIWIILTRNLIHGVMMFAIVLISLAGIFVLIGATFLAVVQILLYAGGVLVLIAFGVMLTRRSTDGRLISRSHLIIPGVIGSLGLSTIIFLNVGSFGFGQSQNSMENVNAIKLIGMTFLTQHIVAFELIAYLLLVVLVGASYFAKNSSPDG